MNNKKNGITEHLTRLRPLEYVVIILGYGAVYVNFIFVLIAIIKLARRKFILPHWISIFNVLIFIIQIIYFILIPSHAYQYN